ncbi:MAG: type II toxin-antitoxin system VapC family toxin [Acidobacteriota bacterium]
MKIYVLDTDICGFVQSSHSNTLQQLMSLPAEAVVVTTIITFGEDLSGWLPACRHAKDGITRSKAFARLQNGLKFYLKRRCLPFDDAAVVIFDKLKSLKLHIGNNDLSIAAITLAVGGILVTRNAKDFQRIPDLPLEDWTV